MLTGDAYDMTPDADLDGVRFEGLDLTGRDGTRARILECEIVDCDIERLVLDHARVLDTTVRAARAGTLRAASSMWRDVVLADVRIGALSAAGSSWTRVTVTGGKVDYLDLRDATVEDLRVEGATVGDLDLAHARVRRLTVVDGDVQRLDTTESRLTEVDLRGARLRSVDGVAGLRGAVVSHDQLLDLAPLLADQLGITVC